MIAVAILCGGRGTRIQHGTGDVSKPLVDIGGRPILWHVMALYAEQGFTEFVLLAGWRASRIAEAVEAFPEVAAGDWQVELLDGGDSTPTGGRLFRARDVLGDSTFALTYADGVAGIDLRAELELHRESDALATIAVVQPNSPWGVAELEIDGRISAFREKPRLEGWINGGFMLMEPGVFEHLRADDILERDTMKRLARARRLYSYRHDGFWACMDTQKDWLMLNELCEHGGAPWLRGDLPETVAL